MTVTAAIPFVGRDPERVELRLALNDTFGGRGQAVPLLGEPGIGKTRVASGRCWEGRGAPAFWPSVEALPKLIDDRPLARG